MGLLDEVMGMLTGGKGQNQMLGSLLQMLGGTQGGLAGLVKAFSDKGLGDVVGSWVGTGANLPVSPDQIQQVLGKDRVQQLAQQHGLAPDALASQLAQVLPGFVDKLTPGGQLPDAQGLEGLLKGLLR
ncbi:MAG TPA: YidB family protein [Anaeromyxobacteraceae bacterium]|nr:YidB family protein [Anaeromyxobacteraceae bacterium]